MSEKERDTTWWIFDKRWLCTTVQDAVTTNEEIQLLGSYTTMKKGTDINVRSARQNFYLPISEMATIVEKGYPLSIVKHSDVPKIYNHVQDHLMRWIEAAKGTLNGIKVPVDDLMLLDRFAAKVYPVAAVKPQNITAAGSGGGMFNSAATAVMKDIFQDAVTARKKDDPLGLLPKEPKFAPRVSLSDQLFDLLLPPGERR